MRAIRLLALSLILLFSLPGCGVFDNPLHLPPVHADSVFRNQPVHSGDEQGDEQPSGDSGDDTAAEDDGSDQQAG